MLNRVDHQLRKFRAIFNNNLIKKKKKKKYQGFQSKLKKTENKWKKILSSTDEDADTESSEDGTFNLVSTSDSSEDSLSQFKTPRTYKGHKKKSSGISPPLKKQKLRNKPKQKLKKIAENVSAALKLMKQLQHDLEDVIEDL